MQSKRIFLNTRDVIYIVCVKNILYCKSDNNQTTLHFTNQKSIVVSRNIKEFEKELIPYCFFRTHQSYLVNLAHIQRIEKLEGFCLILPNDLRIPTSTRKKKELLQILQIK